jgi:hypothetical protein
MRRKEMRKLSAPIFGSNPIPFGRMGDVCRLFTEQDQKTIATIPSSKSWDSGFFLVRFKSQEERDQKILEDRSLCPASMGGGSKGMGPAQKNLQPLERFATAFKGK